MRDLTFCLMVKVGESDLQMFRDCLESLKAFEPHAIHITMDTRSIPEATEIAQEYGAQVFMREWDDNFANGRNHSISFADTKWIGIIDHDEAFDQSDIPGMIECLENERTYAAIRIQTLSEAPYGASINYVPRFFINGKMRYEGAKHHAPILDGACRYFPARIHHKGYNLSKAEQQAKNQRDIEIMERQLSENPHDPYVLRNMIRSLRSAQEWDRLLETSTELDRLVLQYQLRISDLSMQMTMMDTAYAFLHLDRYEEAQELLKRTAEAFPYHPDPHFHLGNVSFTLEDFEESVRAYNEYIIALSNLRMSKEPPTLICETWSLIDIAYRHTSYAYAAIGEPEKSSQAFMAGFMNMAQGFVSEWSRRILDIKRREEVKNAQEEGKPPLKLILPGEETAQDAKGK